MLQVVNLTKVYKSKHGADTRALDGVTLQFPEKGMVFLLGKSGSGKSTLLNVCGGLDNPTSGEIIVKGRSSKNFSQSDFDSYRNTFIGFIFQEYNILNEFSVEDNIALALELQGKSKDKKAIAKLLEDVDLGGFAKRKPNTLSGGQKQRIAIARALVKNPEIIMADEPTGALDSNTGRQVFDTLKKLSQDKLVLVVSHDREFAEQYGDRIIELKDGKILSDVSKTQQQQQALTQNVSTLGNVLSLKKGSELTSEDFEQIKTFLKNAPADVVIASGEKEVKNFKKASRINDAGEQEVFADTDESTLGTKAYTKEDSKFIRSKLPGRHAAKIGLSGMKNKPFRLFFTVLLCTVAFVMFGLLSTLNFYNSERTFRETLTLAAPEYLRADKQYQATVTWYSYGEEGNSYVNFFPAKFSPEDINQLKELTGDRLFGTVDVYLSLSTRNTSQYWAPQIGMVGHLPEGHVLRDRITGEYPDQANEIVLSSYFADLTVACQIYDAEGRTIEITNPQELIGQKIALDGTTYTVTGLFDCGPVDGKFDSLKDSSNRNESLQMELTQYLANGLFQFAFVEESQLQTLSGRFENYWKNEPYSYHALTCDAVLPGEAADFPQWSNAHYLKQSDAKSTWIYHSVSGKTAPSEGEAIVTAPTYYNALQTLIYQKINLVQEGKEEWTQESEDEVQSLYTLVEACNVLAYGRRWEETEDGKGEEILLTEAEKEVYRQKLAVFEAENAANLSIAFQLFNNSNQSSFGEEYRCSIIGFYDVGDEYQEYLILSDSQADALWNEQKTQIESYEEWSSDYVEPADAIYEYLYLPYDQTEAQKDLYWEMYNAEDFEENGTRISLVGSFVEDLRRADSIIKTLATVFLYVGLVLLAFAVLLFSNFIATSISQKKREIGILRAVGARSFDVFKIFFSESFFIAALCSVLALVGCFVICHFINLRLTESIGASLVVFGIPSVAVLLGVALLTAVISTFLPVYKAAKKKPVDSIRAI